MAKVVLTKDTETGEPESIETLIKRFKKQVMKDEILLECKKRQYFRPKAVKRHEKSVAAQKRLKSKKKKVRQY